MEQFFFFFCEVRIWDVDQNLSTHSDFSKSLAKGTDTLRNDVRTFMRFFCVMQTDIVTVWGAG